jgi:hypothetical protein
VSSLDRILASSYPLPVADVRMILRGLQAALQRFHHDEQAYPALQPSDILVRRNAQTGLVSGVTLGDAEGRVGMADLIVRLRVLFLTMMNPRTLRRPYVEVQVSDDTDSEVSRTFPLTDPHEASRRESVRRALNNAVNRLQTTTYPTLEALFGDMHRVLEQLFDVEPPTPGADGRSWRGREFRTALHHDPGRVGGRVDGGPVYGDIPAAAGTVWSGCR